MTITPSIDDPRYEAAAAEVLRRHNNGQAEENIRIAIRDFLITAGLAEAESMSAEAPPAPGSGKAVDLVTGFEAGEAYIETKRRIGGAGGGINPLPEHVNQIDGYLRAAHDAGRTGRMGVLTDGKYWVLRWRGALAEPSRVYPYAFTLESSDRWFALYEWLRDNALITYENEYPDRDRIVQHFSTQSAAYEREIAGLRL